MSARPRLAAAALALAGLAPAGCVDAEADLVLDDRGAVTGGIEVVAPAGQRDLGAWRPPAQLADRVDAAATTAGDRDVLSVTVRGVDFADFAAAVAEASGGAVHAELDRPGAEPGSLTGLIDLGGQPAARVRLAVGLPAGVDGSNGALGGDGSVRWTAEGGTATRLWAELPRRSGGGRVILQWAAILALAGVGAAAAAFAWAGRDRWAAPRG